MRPGLVGVALPLAVSLYMRLSSPFNWKSFLFKYIFPYFPSYLLAVVMIVLTNYLMILIPQSLNHIITTISERPSSDLIYYSSFVVRQSLLIIILAASHIVTRSISRILIFFPARRVEHNLRVDLQKKILNCPYSFFKKYSKGDLISRIINDVNNIRLVIAVSFLQFINTVSAYILVSLSLSKLALPLVFFILIPLPIALFFGRPLVKKYYDYSKDSQEIVSTMTQQLYELFNHFVLVKSFLTESSFIRRFQKINLSLKTCNVKVALVRSLMFPFMQSAAQIGTVLFLTFGSIYVSRGVLSIGDFVEIISYVFILAWPTSALAWVISLLERGKVSIQRLSEVFADTSDPHLLFAQKAPFDLSKAPSITVQNLSFSVSNDNDNSNPKTIFSDLNFSIPPHSSLGIFGQTGSGKSSLLHMLSLRHFPSKGTVFLNDRDIYDYPLSVLRNSISYIDQNVFLFSQKISENISGQFDEFWIDYHFVENASRLACFHEDVLSFPQGYETVVGRQAIVLSGGQRKRLALARALHKTPSLLFLDDVLSAIDHETEQRLLDHIFDLPYRPTTIIISHRISALSYCDQVLILEEGHPPHMAPPHELIHQKGIYQDAWNYQQTELKRSQS